MTDKPHMLLWVDVETTGLDPATDRVLEVGLKLTGMRGESRSVDLHEFCQCDSVPLDDPFIVDTFTANGLFRDVRDHGRRPSDVAAVIDGFLDDLAERYILHQAGTNVQFDLKFLGAMGVKLDRLSHRRLDVTAFRLASMAAGRDPYDESHATSHRVFDCLGRDIRDYGNYLKLWER